MTPSLSPPSQSSAGLPFFAAPSSRRKLITTRLHTSSRATQRPVSEARRQTLLSRKGSHFKLDRFSGTIEFGAAANLVTQLDVVPVARVTTEIADSIDFERSIDDWLQDERSLAMSIWDPKLTKEMGNSVYRLQVMSLQFVTLQLAPWVDVQMKTVLSRSDRTENSNQQFQQHHHQQPVFTLQSVAFDPNVQVLPGLRISADALGIVIEVAGQMRRSGSGVTGTIAFQTTGKLPPPLRILPEPALKAASDAINGTIVKFAVRSFQSGAQKNYKEFLASRAANLQTKQ